MGRVLFIKKFRILSHFLRNINSEILTNELNNGIRKEIEEYWYKRLSPKRGSDNFYVSSVLYPTSIMLSENLRILAIRNAVLRFRQMNDCQVHEAEYWHAHQSLAEDRCESFCRLRKLVDDTKSQLEKLRLSVADCEFSQNSAEFYQRSQFIFLKLFDAGVIFQKKTLITDAEMEKVENVAKMCGKSKALKISRRWFLRTSQFAQDFCQHLHSKGLLENDLDRLHKSWAGMCDGFSFDCSTNISEKLNIWVPNLSLIPLAEFIVVKPNSLFDHLCGETKDANGKLQLTVINPVTSKELPVYVSEDVEFPFGRDTHLGVPSVSENDRRLAEKFGLKLDASDEFCSSVAENQNLEFNRVSSEHGDWPITQNDFASVLVPLVHCPDCGFQSAPEQELPINLPTLPDDFKDFNVFLESNGWNKTVCPNCGGPAEREKTFIDPLFLWCISALRNNGKNKLLPVDLFICGGDKAVYQLYFSRFLAHIVHLLGLCTTIESSRKSLFNNSLLDQTKSHFVPQKGLKFDEIIEKASERFPKVFESDEMIFSDIRNEFGCDFSHLLLLFSSENEKFQLGQSASASHWSLMLPLPYGLMQTEMLTWQNNLWLTVREFVNIRERPLAFVSPWIDITKEEKKLKEVRNRSIRLATLDYSETFDLNSCITVLRKLTNSLRTYTREARKLSPEYEKSLSVLIIMVAPLMPHFAATLWMAFCSAEGRLTNDEEIAWNANVMLQKWPKMDDDYEFAVNLRINSDIILAGGAVRPHEISQLTVDKALDVAKKSRDVRKFLNKHRVLDVELDAVPNLQADLIIVAEQKAKSEEVSVSENRVKNENK